MRTGFLVQNTLLGASALLVAVATSPPKLTTPDPS